MGRGTIVAIALVAVSCGTPNDPTPVPEGPRIDSITPNAGPPGGGTEVTIRGSGFAAGATVTIGGRAATDVTIRGIDSITARTPASPTAGPVDVSVSLLGRTGLLPAGYRYEVIGPNSAPVVKSMVAQGRRLRQPANFADYGETIQISLVVEDAETPASQLIYQWRTCDGGVFTGSGPQVDWTAPIIGSLPSTCTIEVTIVDGPNVLTRSLVVRVHNSVAEVEGLVRDFLQDFANSLVPAETTIRNFSEATSECREGKKAELEDVQRNRRELVINSHTYGASTVTIGFGGVCAFRARPGDACVATPVEWNSTRKDTLAIEIAKGVSHISGVYDSSRWWLCRSDYRPDVGTSLTFMH